MALSSLLCLVASMVVAAGAPQRAAAGERFAITPDDFGGLTAVAADRPAARRMVAA